MSLRREEFTKIGTLRRRGLLFHWYIDLVIAIISISVLLHLLFKSELGLKLLEIETNVLAILVNALGLKAVISGPTSCIVIGRHVITIIMVPLCSGLYGASIFIGTALLLPLKLRDKLVGLLVYTPTFLLINLIRILIGIVIGVLYGITYFRYYHDMVSTPLMIVVFALLWTKWFCNSMKHIFEGATP